jgi:hypothetical protein
MKVFRDLYTPSGIISQWSRCFSKLWNHLKWNVSASLRTRKMPGPWVEITKHSSLQKNCTKLMFTVPWDTEGLVLVDFYEPQSQECYVLHNKLKHPLAANTKVDKLRMFSCLMSIPAHIWHCHEWNNWLKFKVFTSAPYSPDLAPSSYLSPVQTTEGDSIVLNIFVQWWTEESGIGMAAETTKTVLRHQESCDVLD